MIHDLIGRRFTRLLVTGRIVGTKKKSARWICICECGKEKTVVTHKLLSGNTKSCGCLHTDYARILGKLNTKHGHTSGGRPTSEYLAWTNMIVRCTNPKDKRFSDYGKRGIMVCEKWRSSFENFFADIGYRPSNKHSLDRIDVNGNYEPNNVRWATRKEQQSNQRKRIKNSDNIVVLNEIADLRKELNKYKELYGNI